jgi:Ni/Co efflux regulator RcnB
LNIAGSPENNQRRVYMKKIVTMIVAAMMFISFSMVAVAAEEKATEKPAAEKTEKKDVKKDAKKTKKDAKKKEEAKPAAKGKKEVSGC